MKPKSPNLMLALGALGVLLAPTRVVASEEVCGRLFTAAPSVADASALRVSVKLETRGDQLIFDGYPARWFVADRNETQGAKNLGIIQYERDGEARMVKLLDVRLGEVELANGLALNRIGRGPAIRRAGSLSVGDGIESKAPFFIEMAELFPGQKRVTLKSLEKRYKSSFRILRESKFRKLYEGDPATRYTRQIARFWVECLAAGIVPTIDLDFIFFDGKLEPVDFMSYRLNHPDLYTRYVRSANEFIARLKADGGDALSSAFAEDLSFALDTTPGVNDFARQLVKSGLRQ